MKNMENKKKLSPNVIANIIYTLILIITFLLCEWIHFPQQYISFFTFILLGSIVYFVYISVHTQKLLLKKILFLLGLLIIINKLYVPSIFKEKFFINIELGTILIFIIAILMNRKKFIAMMNQVESLNYFLLLKKMKIIFVFHGYIQMKKIFT